MSSVWFVDRSYEKVQPSLCPTDRHPRSFLRTFRSSSVHMIEDVRSVSAPLLVAGFYSEGPAWALEATALPGSAHWGPELVRLPLGRVVVSKIEV